jgi:hypothetical protein
MKAHITDASGARPLKFRKLEESITKQQHQPMICNA